MLWGTVLFALGAVLLIAWMARRIRGRNSVVDETPGLWPDQPFRCPRCDAAMQPGYVMLGRGAIWTPRDGRPVSTFAHIGQSLPNTLSFDLPPATNAAWRCGDCQLLLVDHSRLIRRRKFARRQDRGNYPPP